MLPHPFSSPNFKVKAWTQTSDAENNENHMGIIGLSDFLGINQCKMHVNFQRFPLIIYNRTCFGLENIYRNIMIPAKT